MRHSDSLQRLNIFVFIAFRQHNIAYNISMKSNDNSVFRDPTSSVHVLYLSFPLSARQLHLLQHLRSLLHHQCLLIREC